MSTTKIILFIVLGFFLAMALAKVTTFKKSLLFGYTISILIMVGVYA